MLAVFVLRAERHHEPQGVEAKAVESALAHGGRCVYFVESHIFKAVAIVEGKVADGEDVGVAVEPLQLCAAVKGVVVNADDGVLDSLTSHASR